MRHRLESSEIWTGLALARPGSSHSKRIQTAHGRFMHSNRRIISCIFINVQLGYSFVSFPSTPLVPIIPAWLSPASPQAWSPPEDHFFFPGELCLSIAANSFSPTITKPGRALSCAAFLIAGGMWLCYFSSLKITNKNNNKKTIWCTPTAFRGWVLKFKRHGWSASPNVF